MSVTAKTLNLVNNNPSAINFIKEKLSANKISSTKIMGFNVGNDSNKVGNSKIEKMGKILERKGFDSFSVIVYTLKNGQKVGGISVLANRGSYEEFYQKVKGMLRSKADLDKCVINRSDIEEGDELEVYSIFFDYEE